VKFKLKTCWLLKDQKEGGYKRPADYLNLFLVMKNFLLYNYFLNKTNISFFWDAKHPGMD
jgi:hypothetical protein